MKKIISILALLAMYANANSMISPEFLEMCKQLKLIGRKKSTLWTADHLLKNTTDNIRITEINTEAEVNLCTEPCPLPSFRPSYQTISSIKLVFNKERKKYTKLVIFRKLDEFAPPSQHIEYDIEKTLTDADEQFEKQDKDCLRYIIERIKYLYKQQQQQRKLSQNRKNKVLAKEVVRIKTTK